MDSLKENLRAALNFSASEKRGLLVLIIIMILIIIILELLSKYYHQKPDIEIELAYVKFTEQLEKALEEKESTDVLFEFDPNTINSAQMERLNFPKFIIERIEKYRKAGGKFKERDDLLKIYGMPESLFNDLQSYVVIESHNNPKVVYSNEELKKSILDINKADSSEFVELKGIGPVYASRIIAFRKSLGGFCNESQLLEVYGISDSLYVSLSSQVFIDSTYPIISININEVNLKELRKHPYFRNYNLSRSIINYRDQHGNYTSLQDLKKNMLVTDSLSLKISSYINYQ